MNTALLTTLLGLMSATSFGVADFFLAKSAKSVGPILGSTVVSISSAALFSLVFVILFRHDIHLSWPGIWFAVGSAFFMASASINFFLALEAGPVSIVSPLASTYPLIMTLLVLAIFRIHLSPQEVGGILLTVTGVLVASGILGIHGLSRRMRRGSVFALITAFSWGIGFALLAQAIRRIGWQFATLFECDIVVIVYIFALPFIKGSEVISLKTLRRGMSNKFVLTGSIVQLLGGLAINLGISRSSANGGTIITAISSCYPIITIALALKHFKEDVGLIPLAGAALGIAGIVMLSL